MSFNLGWVAYSSLRQDLMAPRSSSNRYYGLLPGLSERLGDKIHWMPLKELHKGCEMPLLTAPPEEVLAHQSVYHYGTNFGPMVRHINRLPVQGRWQATEDQPFDFSTLQYGIPRLDICILESTGQIGGAHAIDYLARQLYKANPQINFIVVDADRSAATTFAKLKKWYPDWRSRTIVTANYLKRSTQWYSHVPVLSPHLSNLKWPHKLDGEGMNYVGNDYQRREPMDRILGAPGMHWWGQLRPRKPGATYSGYQGMTSEDFLALLTTKGCTHHGPFNPNMGFTIEQCYRTCAAAIQICRDDCYPLHHFSVRPSEIARAGMLAFWDRKHTLGGPLASDFCRVNNGAEAIQRLDYLRHNVQQWAELIEFQWNALAYYTSSERIVDAYYRTALRLLQGPTDRPWELNVYQDLMAVAGIPVWGHN